MASSPDAALKVEEEAAERPAAFGPHSFMQAKARRSLGARILEWLFRTRALAEARRQEAEAVDVAFFQQARELVEVADRLALRTEPPQAGSGLGTALVLYREALEVCRRGNAGSATLALPLTESLPFGPGVGRAAADALSLATNEFIARLGERQRVAQVRMARELLQSVVTELDAPRRRRLRVLVQRVVRPGAVVVFLLGVAAVVVKLTSPPDLLLGRSFRTSSLYAGFNPTEGKCDGQRTQIFFHTNKDKRPFVEFDLGSVRSVRRVRVVNRHDCCGERAVPLAVEVSTDRTTWKQVARRAEIFESFERSFAPVQARYLRVVAQGTTWLHLEQVAAW